MPTFLDLDLDDQQRSLLQAWMCSDPPGSLPEVREAALAHLHRSHRRTVGYSTSVMVVCSAGSETPFAIPNIENLIFGDEATCNFVYVCGQATGTATAAAAPAYPCAGDDRPLPLFSEEEAESASIENDRVIAFRAIAPEARQALHSANVRLSPDAIRFVARARGRRLRFEEDPETQSE